MNSQKFNAMITIQAVENKKEESLKLLKDAFDDPSLTLGEFFHSQEDPEILMALFKWSSPGVFETFLQKKENHLLFQKDNGIIDFIQVTRWISIS